MQHTVAAVFDKHNQAQGAFDDLIASGFERDNVHLAGKDTTGEGSAPNTKATVNIFGGTVRANSITNGASANTVLMSQAEAPLSVRIDVESEKDRIVLRVHGPLVGLTVRLDDDSPLGDGVCVAVVDLFDENHL